MIEVEEESRTKLKQLLIDRLNGNDQDAYLAPIETRDFKVVFGIITYKDKRRRSKNLPLFSRINLMKVMRQLDLVKTPSAFAFIEDRSPKKGGHPKYQPIMVEVCLGDAGRTEVRPAAGQRLDGYINKSFRGCPKPIRESPIGTRFKLAVKMSDKGELSSHHSWPFERLN